MMLATSLDLFQATDSPVPGQATIGMVKSTVTRDGKTSTERRFYLSSASLDVMAFAASVRAHWRIESVPQRHTERSSR